MTVAVITYLRTPPNTTLLALSAGLAAGIGAVTLPLLGWAFLRAVPLRAAIVGTSIGTALGAAVGLLVGARAVNPYAPFSVFLPPCRSALRGRLPAPRLPPAECVRISTAGHAFARLPANVRWSRQALGASGFAPAFGVVQSTSRAWRVGRSRLNFMR
jgi:hypothetical protein